ncbi:hypothetical protein M011DRAFT_482371 [Sporormia fimetaria CBS 119925]|uniref:Uncharacterized protein n=1 Tax=Sporormia fimetaria CBS 119925 TaxID=1340428 RepID=A0A6A6UW68_9PLEO|nr:hypothetical protein M011DRAFT_482371 [Sporormia fimetaria CBS 119925]
MQSTTFNQYTALVTIKLHERFAGRQWTINFDKALGQGIALGTQYSANMHLNHISYLDAVFGTEQIPKTETWITAEAEFQMEVLNAAQKGKITMQLRFTQPLPVSLNKGQKCPVIIFFPTEKTANSPYTGLAYKKYALRGVTLNNGSAVGRQIFDPIPVANRT